MGGKYFCNECGEEIKGIPVYYTNGENEKIYECDKCSNKKYSERKAQINLLKMLYHINDD